MLYILMTLLLGFAAVNTGNNLLYLQVSALLGFMAVSGVLGKWNLSKLAVRCVPPEEIYDGLPTLMRVELVNRRRWLPVFFMEVVLADQAVLFPIVEPGKSDHRSLEVTLRGRGEQPLPSVTLRSRFPINFFIRLQGVPSHHTTLVFPYPQPCQDLQQPDPGGDRGSRTTWLKGVEGDISRISDYRGGEPLKLIHWKLSARHDKLKIKELSAATATPVVLDLNEVPGHSLEQRLSCLTYLVTRLLRSGRPVGLRLGRQEFAPNQGRGHKLQLLKALALYGSHQETA